jgi:hypothetical protein
MTEEIARQLLLSRIYFSMEIINRTCLDFFELKDKSRQALSISV